MQKPSGRNENALAICVSLMSKGTCGDILFKGRSRLLAAVGELKPYGRKVGTGGRSISAGDGHEMSWHSSKRMALNAVPGWRCTTTNTEDKTGIFVRMLLLRKSNSSNAAEKYFETGVYHLPICIATWHHSACPVYMKAPVYKDSWISYRLKWPSYFLPLR